MAMTQLGHEPSPTERENRVTGRLVYPVSGRLQGRYGPHKVGHGSGCIPFSQPCSKLRLILFDHPFIANAFRREDTGQKLTIRPGHGCYTAYIA
jgi:hypothetical protein